MPEHLSIQGRRSGPARSLTQSAAHTKAGTSDTNTSRRRHLTAHDTHESSSVGKQFDTLLARLRAKWNARRNKSRRHRTSRKRRHHPELTKCKQVSRTPNKSCKNAK
eukprot:5411273-Amphidinium_carterae.1